MKMTGIYNGVEYDIVTINKNNVTIYKNGFHETHNHESVKVIDVDKHINTNPIMVERLLGLYQNQNTHKTPDISEDQKREIAIEYFNAFSAEVVESITETGKSVLREIQEEFKKFMDKDNDLVQLVTKTDVDSMLKRKRPNLYENRLYFVDESSLKSSRFLHYGNIIKLVSVSNNIAFDNQYIVIHQVNSEPMPLHFISTSGFHERLKLVTVSYPQINKMIQLMDNDKDFAMGVMCSSLHDNLNELFTPHDVRFEKNGDSILVTLIDDTKSTETPMLYLVFNQGSIEVNHIYRCGNFSKNVDDINKIIFNWSCSL